MVTLEEKLGKWLALRQTKEYIVQWNKVQAEQFANELLLLIQRNARQGLRGTDGWDLTIGFDALRRGVTGWFADKANDDDVGLDVIAKKAQAEEGRCDDLLVENDIGRRRRQHFEVASAVYVQICGMGSNTSFEFKAGTAVTAANALMAALESEYKMEDAR